MAVHTETPAQTTGIPEKLPSEAETADILGVAPGTLQVWRSTGRYDLPYVKVGGKIRYPPPGLRAFIKRRTMSHTSKKYDPTEDTDTA